jgi:hypothetical protein
MHNTHQVKLLSKQRITPPLSNSKFTPPLFNGLLRISIHLLNTTQFWYKKTEKFTLPLLTNYSALVCTYSAVLNFDPKRQTILPAITQWINPQYSGLLRHYSSLLNSGVNLLVSKLSTVESKSNSQRSWIASSSIAACHLYGVAPPS